MKLGGRSKGNPSACQLLDIEEIRFATVSGLPEMNDLHASAKIMEP